MGWWRRKGGAGHVGVPRASRPARGPRCVEGLGGLVHACACRQYHHMAGNPPDDTDAARPAYCARVCALTSCFATRQGPTGTSNFLPCASRLHRGDAAVCCCTVLQGMLQYHSQGDYQVVKVSARGAVRRGGAHAPPLEHAKDGEVGASGGRGTSGLPAGRSWPASWPEGGTPAQARHGRLTGRAVCLWHVSAGHPCLSCCLPRRPHLLHAHPALRRCSPACGVTQLLHNHNCPAGQDWLRSGAPLELELPPALQEEEARARAEAVARQRLADAAQAQAQVAVQRYTKAGRPLQGGHSRQARPANAMPGWGGLRRRKALLA